MGIRSLVISRSAPFINTRHRSSAVDGLYVAPNLYTRLDELDQFVAAMRQAARNGVGA